MNKVIPALLAVLTFTSCYQTIERTQTYTVRVPIYQSSTEAEAEAGLLQGSPTTLTTFGAIYIYDDYLLINERGQGIHIYDNSDPVNPVQLSFMNIPGNFDMAIRKNVLYVDSYDDVLALDISNINNIQLLKRLDGVFPDYHPGVPRIVGYKDSVIEVSEKHQDGLINWEEEDDFDSRGGFEVQTTGNFTGGPTETGTGGSFARFTVANQHLYAVDFRRLHVFDVTNEVDPLRHNSVNIQNTWAIETIFPYGEHLFIGSTDGMFIYNISDPKVPTYTSAFMHVRMCDPVYVKDSVAFVTLRSGNRCPGIANQLDIIDVSDIAAPELVRTAAMVNPHGVGADDSLLFICEAGSGLKIYDYQKIYTGNELSDVRLNLLNWNRNIFAYDVIPHKGNLIVVGENALFQYDYTNVNDIKLLSKIE
jgi:hypothetical protein